MHVEQLLELAERQLYAISPLLTFSNKNSALSASPYGPATIELLALLKREHNSRSVLVLVDQQLLSSSF
jgi:hypothetical protein